MEIDHKTVDEIAHLARLEFQAEAKDAIVKDINRMLAFVNKLQELDTENVEPLVYMTEERNVMREDIAKETIKQDDALKNAPKKDSDYFKVSKVISQNK
jgi:aspartyl-tRNA(Asn)/glutamyl-tRNA(Gln) amidotransferase subunit C